MDTIDNAATADTYTAATRIQNVYGSNGGYFQLSGADAFLELQYGTQGSEIWTPEVHVSPGIGQILPGTIGFQFRSYLTGTPATVTAALSTRAEPAFAIAAGSSSQPITGPLAITAQGHKTTNAGTRVALIAASTPCLGVAVRAFPTNTGLVYVGNNAVSNANGYELNANDAVGFDVINVNGVFIDVDVNGEGCSWMAVL